MRRAVVICDMWDAHHCISAARRVAELASHMNGVVAGLRTQGALIIHAPGDCTDYYRGTTQRLRATQAPRTTPPRPPDWNVWDAAREAVLPESLADTGPCSCESAEPCNDGRPPYPWTRQIATIGISSEDAITDDGAEFFNLLSAEGIAEVLIMGVHTNICVLSRPYGIRQLVYWGLQPILCRDLTDSFHRDARGHVWGTEQIVTHIERYWCPTVTSDELVGGAPFQFGGGQ